MKIYIKKAVAAVGNLIGVFRMCSNNRGISMEQCRLKINSSMVISKLSKRRKCRTFKKKKKEKCSVEIVFWRTTPV